MDRRAQSALEYLMTYGWALIVIAIVVGVLIFIVSSPTSGVVCTSSDPAKMIMKQYNMGSLSPREIILQNATGGSITVTAIGTQDVNGSFAPAVPIANNPGVTPGTVVGGGSTRIVPSCVDCNTPGATVSGLAALRYTDPFGYAKTVVISCQGKAA